MCSKQFFLSFLLSQQVLLPTLFASGWIEDRFTASTKKPRVPARGFLFLRGNMLHSSFFCQQYSTTSILDCQILLLAALCSSFLFHKENRYCQQFCANVCSFLLQFSVHTNAPNTECPVLGVHIKILKLQPFFQFMRLLLSHPHTFKEHRKLTMQNNSLD